MSVLEPKLVQALHSSLKFHANYIETFYGNTKVRVLSRYPRRATLKSEPPVPFSSAVAPPSPTPPAPSAAAGRGACLVIYELAYDRCMFL
jgi:hypothetical protein